jgi:hypothetical protein
MCGAVARASVRTELSPAGDKSRGAPRNAAESAVGRALRRVRAITFAA